VGDTPVDKGEKGGIDDCYSSQYKKCRFIKVNKGKIEHRWEMPMVMNTRCRRRDAAHHRHSRRCDAVAA